MRFLRGLCFIMQGMKILGIDPGSTRIGYGAVETGNNLVLIDYGIIEIKRKETKNIIAEAAAQLSKIIEKYRPNLIGIEKIYFVKNVKTGIEVAQTRGALILQMNNAGVPVLELSPSEIKLAVAGYGLADKKAVAKMAGKILRLENLHGFDDASDALAIAITTAYQVKTYFNNIF